MSLSVKLALFDNTFSSFFMTLKPIIFVGGYANSGKSTFLSICQSNGYQVVSTSQTLDKFTAMVLAPALDNFSNIEHLLRQKDSYLETELYSIGMGSIRSTKIHFAENVIVPLYGRKNGLIVPTIGLIDWSNNEPCFFESIGSEEFELTLDCLGEKYEGCYSIHKVNLVSDDQLENVDIREPLPDAITIKNNKRGISELQDCLDSLIRHLA